MNMLMAVPVAPLLAWLFVEDNAATNPEITTIPYKEHEGMLCSKTEYLAFYGSLKNLWLSVSAETGRLLYMLPFGVPAKAIVEFSTSFGILSLRFAVALMDNGDRRGA